MLLQVLGPVLGDALLARPVTVRLAKLDRFGDLTVAHQLDATREQLAVQHRAGGLNGRMRLIHGFQRVLLLDVDAMLTQVGRVHAQRRREQRLAAVLAILSLTGRAGIFNGVTRRHGPTTNRSPPFTTVHHRTLPTPHHTTHTK